MDTLNNEPLSSVSTTLSCQTREVNRLRPKSASVYIPTAKCMPREATSQSPTTRIRDRPVKPRPPSASIAMRRARVIHPSTNNSSMNNHSYMNATPSSIMSPVGVVHPTITSIAAEERYRIVSPQIMREEIETQRRVTRQAQRSYDTLHVQLTNKRQEIELFRRHLETFQSATTVIEAPTHGATVTPLHDHIRRLDQYKTKLKRIKDRLKRQLQFMQANTELLEAKYTSATREQMLFQEKLAQERSTVTEVESKYLQRQRENDEHLQHTRQIIKSIEQEILGRTVMHQQRIQADQRRDEMLRLVDREPNTAKKVARRYSCNISNTTVIAHPGVSASLGPSLGASYLHRESVFQIYETQYQRLLEETGESDVDIVLERFRSYQETVRRLLEIESDLKSAHGPLLERWKNQDAIIQELRVSGIAEVEKRKKIRDFIEAMYHSKSQLKEQTKEAFIEQLKTFAFVQQGILNLTELFKCWMEDNGKIMIPPLPTWSMTTTASSAETQWYISLIQFCISVARQQSVGGMTTPLNSTQIERLTEIEPSLGDSGVELKILVPRPTPWTIEEEKARDEISTPFVREKDSDSNGESEDDDRHLIKQNTVDTLHQVDLLVEALDAKQENTLRPENKMVRLRRVEEVNSIASKPTTETKLMDSDKRMAAIHAYFREKRQREKFERQQEREKVALLAMSTVPNGPGPSRIASIKSHATEIIETRTSKTNTMVGLGRKRSNSIMVTSPTVQGLARPHRPLIPRSIPIKPK